jgi:hypothetical protein
MKKVISVLMLSIMVTSSGCGPRARSDTADRSTLKKLARYKAIPKIDRRGCVVELKLEGKRVSDDALDELGGLTELRSLSLFAADISDEGLEKLQAVVSLDSLGLCGTPITDNGLTALHKMKNLRHLWLSKASFTTVALDELREAVPGLIIYLQ